MNMLVSHIASPKYSEKKYYTNLQPPDNQRIPQRRIHSKVPKQKSNIERRRINKQNQKRI